MPEFCLTLVGPPEIEERLLDALLALDQNLVFTTTPTFSLGTAHSRLSNTEQVMGRSRAVQVQILANEDELTSLLTTLRASFAGTGLRYWAMPIAQAGEIE